MGPGDEAGRGVSGRPRDGGRRGPRELDVRGLDAESRTEAAAAGRGLGFWDGVAPTSKLRRCQLWINRMYSSQDHLSWDRWEGDHRGLLPGPPAGDPKLAHVATAGPHDHHQQQQQHCPGVHAPPLKRNPLYRADAASGGATAPHATVDALSPLARVPPRSQAAWTLEEFSRRAVAPGARPTPAMQRALRASQPERLEFWLEDVTTPGYEALLRRKEQQERRWRSLRCAALTLATLAALALLAGLAAVAVKFWVKL